MAERRGLWRILLSLQFSYCRFVSVTEISPSLRSGAFAAILEDKTAYPVRCPGPRITRGTTC